MGTSVAKWTFAHSYHFMSKIIITICIIIIFPALELVFTSIQFVVIKQSTDSSLGNAH